MVKCYVQTPHSQLLMVGFLEVSDQYLQRAFGFFSTALSGSQWWHIMLFGVGGNQPTRYALGWRSPWLFS